MIIETNINYIASRANSLRSKSVEAINAIREEVLTVAGSEIPAAYETKDMSAFSQKLSEMANNELKPLADVIDGYASCLDSVANAYREAQINALTNALMF